MLCEDLFFVLCRMNVFYLISFYLMFIVRPVGFSDFLKLVLLFSCLVLVVDLVLTVFARRTIALCYFLLHKKFELTSTLILRREIP